MSVTRSARVLIATAALAAAGLGAADATSAASRLPSVPTYLQPTRAYGILKVRPGEIGYTGDGTGAISGADVHHGRIHWTHWDRRVARGTGYDQLNDCKPTCAGGHFTGYPVKVVAWRPGTVKGALIFTRLTLFFTRRVPYGKFRHYTFSNETKGGFGYGPPGAEGYCMHTHGLTPDPACRNIHTLPHLR